MRRLLLKGHQRGLSEELTIVRGLRTEKEKNDSEVTVLNNLDMSVFN